MDSLQLTSPNSSPSGLIDTIEDQEDQNDTIIATKHMILSESPIIGEFYQRQALVLPLRVDPQEDLSLIDRAKYQLISRAEIDIKTALVEGYQIAFENESGELSVIIGYDAIERIFAVVADDGIYQTLMFEDITESPTIGELWTLHT